MGRVRISGLRLAVAWLLSLLPWAVVQAGDSASGNQECAMCHIMWLTDFKRANQPTIIPYEPQQETETGKQDASSTERMCFSCHDGFVLDSRFMWENRDYSHPVGVVPSKAVKIPTPDGKTIFPLNNEGKLYCGSCHSAHGVSWDRTDSPVFLRMANTESSICLACHNNRQGGHGNHPTQVKLTETPPALKGQGAKFGKSGTVICQSCHRMHGARDEHLMVIADTASGFCTACHTGLHGETAEASLAQGLHPVNVKIPNLPQSLAGAGAATGDGGTLICTTCHRPHRAADSPLLAVGNGRSELCQSCHEAESGHASHPTGVRLGANLPAGLASGGGKLGGGQVICQTCHNPHGKAGHGHLLVRSNKDSALCTTCHSQQVSVKESLHNLQGLPGLTANIKGQPASAGTCTICHVAHGSQAGRLWAREPAKAADGRIMDPCEACHTPGGLAPNSQVGEHSHPVGVLLPKAAKGGGDASGTVSCASCHDPHLSRAAGPFLRAIPGDQDSLCLRCHDDKAAIKGTDHDMSDANHSAGCRNCHAVHNASTDTLWAMDFGPGQDSAERQCRACHQAGGIAETKVPARLAHPSQTISSPRKGDGGIAPPLLDSRGGLDTRGVISCPTCHDPHRWTPAGASVVRRGPEGDVLSSFLRQTGTAAALCSNCHGAEGLLRYKDYHSPGAAN